jgi:hypothetical protein
VNEHILSAIIADDEAETFLRIEEFDDAFAFADDLRGHSATAAATAASETSAAAAAVTAASAAEAAAVAVATPAASAAEAAAITITSPAASAAAEAAALLVTGPYFTCKIVFAEAFALIPTATAAVSFAPSIETHIRPNLCAR